MYVVYVGSAHVPPKLEAIRIRPDWLKRGAVEQNLVVQTEARIGC